MKRIFTFMLALGAGFSGFGQSQRLVMFEEFTQASCPPLCCHQPWP